MNLTARAQIAHMHRTVLDLQRRIPRQRGRPRLVPLEMLKALYRNALNGATRAYLRTRKETEPWKRPH
jgi:hypothetical protein